MACTRQVWAPQAIESYFVTRADDYNFPGYQKRVSRLGVLIPANVPATAAGVPSLSLSFYFDLDQQASVRAVDLAHDEHWKMFRMNPRATGSRSGTVVQVRVGYIGAQAIDVEQLQIGFQVIGRRARFR